MTRRLSKILMCLSLCLFAALVAFDNLVDDANLIFVQHVMSMDTTPPGNAEMHRAVTSPAAWRAVYALIVASEAAIALLFLVAAGALFRARRDALRFEAAKRWVVAGATLAFLLYFLGFMVGGGEWFAMWRSHLWNGQEPAFRFVLVVMAVLLYVDRPEPA